MNSTGSASAAHLRREIHMARAAVRVSVAVGRPDVPDLVLDRLRTTVRAMAATGRRDEALTVLTSARGAVDEREPSRRQWVHVLDALCDRFTPDHVLVQPADATPERAARVVVAVVGAPAAARRPVGCAA